MGRSCYETAWLILQKLRRAMVAPERELLKGSRQFGKKALIGAAIEVRGGGSGRLRLAMLANSRATTLEAFAKTTTAPGSIVHTGGLDSYRGLARLGYRHRPRKQTTAAPGEHLLPPRTARSPT